MFDWKTVEGRGHSDEEREWFRVAGIDTAYRFGPHITIVNIGVYRGCSMHCFRVGAPSAFMYGIDIKTYDVVRPDILNATIIRADSTKYHAKLNIPIHLLFIDGSHKPGDVLADIEGWGPKVAVDGIMAFHDYERTKEEYAFRPRSCGSRQLIGVREAVDRWWGRPDVCEQWEEIPAAGSIRAFKRITMPI